jgi:hypothetical protein
MRRNAPAIAIQKLDKLGIIKKTSGVVRFHTAKIGRHNELKNKDKLTEGEKKLKGSKSAI